MGISQVLRVRIQESESIKGGRLKAKGGRAMLEFRLQGLLIYFPVKNNYDKFVP